jgi:hypothetical protein
MGERLMEFTRNVSGCEGEPGESRKLLFTGVLILGDPLGGLDLLMLLVTTPV